MMNRPSFLSVTILVLALNNVLCIVPIVLVHGGAGSVAVDRFPGKFRGTKFAAKVGYKILNETGSVLDAVEQAIRTMEVDSNFNAGYGGVLTRDGEVEMDACLMDGKTMDVGSVSGVQNIYHPISLARKVMEKTPYNFLGAKGAMKLAEDENFTFLKPGVLVSDLARVSLERWRNAGSGKFDIGEGNTVGAVAIDEDGNIAAGTSTGGLTGKMSGRIGDSPIVGAGTFADNNFAGFSATGEGEVIMKAVLVYDIVKRMDFKDQEIQSAAQDACDDMTQKFGGDGGVIGIDKDGNVAIAFSSEQMSWAYQRGNKLFYGINPGDNMSEDVN